MQHHFLLGRLYATSWVTFARSLPFSVLPTCVYIIINLEFVSQCLARLIAEEAFSVCLSFFRFCPCYVCVSFYISFYVSFFLSACCSFFLSISFFLSFLIIAPHKTQHVHAFQIVCYQIVNAAAS